MPIADKSARLRRLSHIRGLIADEFNSWADLRDELPKGDLDKPQARAVASVLEVALVKLDNARHKARL